MKFEKDGAIDEFTSQLVVHCLQSEYEEALNSTIIDYDDISCTTMIIQEVSTSSVIPAAAICGSPMPAERKLVGKLSPVVHRPPTNKKQRVTFGNMGLRKLELIVNYKTREVWHEEMHFDE